MPTIVALVKHVPDTWSTKSLNDDHTLDRTSVDNIIDEINEYSVEPVSYTHLTLPTNREV